jgi:hypothetical protein
MFCCSLVSFDFIYINRKHARGKWKIDEFNHPSDIIEKSAIHEIQNFTATGYRSEMFNQMVRAFRYTPDMARREIEDYT